MLKRIVRFLKRISLALARKISTTWVTKRDCKPLIKDVPFEMTKTFDGLTGENRDIGIKCVAPDARTLKKALASEVAKLVELYWLGDRMIPDGLRRQFDNLRPFVDDDKTTAWMVSALSRPRDESPW